LQIFRPTNRLLLRRRKKKGMISRIIKLFSIPIRIFASLTCIYIIGNEILQSQRWFEQCGRSCVWRREQRGEERIVKECSLYQCRSWSRREKRTDRAIGLLSRVLNRYIKVLILGKRKQESERNRAKEDRQPMFDLRERIHLFLTGMRIFPFFWQRAFAPHRSHHTDIRRKNSDEVAFESSFWRRTAR